MRHSVLLVLLIAIGVAACSDGGSGPGRIPSQIELSETSVTLDDGSTTPVTASVLDQHGDVFETLPAGLTLTWRSSDEAIASINSGLIAANHPGEAQITASVGDLSARVDVTVRTVATAIRYAGGDEQGGTAGESLSDRLSVRAVDRHGTGVAGVSVDFVVTSGEGSISPAAIDTDADGYARGVWTLGSAAGVHTAEARASGLSGSPVVFSATGTAGAAATVRVVSGDDQAAIAGTTLPDSLLVQVVDTRGNPVPDETVSWIVAAGGGSVSPGTATTDSEGYARAAWTLGSAAGVHTAEARASGLSGSPVTFSATGTAGAAATVRVVSGDDQAAIAGTTLPDSLVVQIVDTRGNPVPDETVSWIVAAGGGSVSPGTSSTNAEGYARAAWTLGSEAGENRAEARASGLSGSPVAFSATGTAGPAATVRVVSGDDQAAIAGTTLPDSLVVQVVDARGNSVSDESVSWIVAAGGGSVSPSTARTDAEGYARAAWTLGSVPGENLVTASVSGITPVSFSASGIDPCRAPTAYQIGTTAAGTLGSLDCQLPDGAYIDYYSTAASEASSLRFTLTSTEIDPFLILYDPAGELVAFNDDRTASDSDASIRILARAGDYIVGATSQGVVASGSYSLQSGSVPSNVSGCETVFATTGVVTVQSITSDDCVRSYGGRLYYSDQFTSPLVAGRTYTITMSSDEFDTQLIIFGSDGKVVASNDDSGGSTNSRIDFIPATTAFYRVDAGTASSEAGGSYTLTIQ